MSFAFELIRVFELLNHNGGVVFGGAQFEFMPRVGVRFGHAPTQTQRF